MLEPTKTLEEMLRAIIEAQVRGGHELFAANIRGASDGTALHDLEDYSRDNFKTHALCILLDTDGLKAAYGEEKKTSFFLNREFFAERWWFASLFIWHNWNSGNGNNVQAAIETAYKLLPPKV